MSIDQHEFEDFRARQARVWALMWLLVFALSLAGFFGVGVAWSYVAGLVLALLFPLVGYEALKRWNRRRWLDRFPELARIDFKWRPDPVVAQRNNRLQ